MKTLTSGNIDFDALATPNLTDAITLPAVVSAGNNGSHTLASRTCTCHLESAVDDERPSARTITCRTFRALRSCSESGTSTCTAIDDWIHFDSP
jgi:hypothetical protein